MVLHCCMPGCKTTGKYGFHKFPRNEEICVKWQTISKTRCLDTRYVPYSHYRLCKKHFTNDDYTKSGCEKNRLSKFSVPSLFIPNELSVEHSYVEWPVDQHELLNELESCNIGNNLKNINQSSEELNVDPIIENVIIDPIHHKVDPDPILEDIVENDEPMDIDDDAIHEHSSAEIKKWKRIAQNARRQLRHSNTRIQFLKKKLEDSTRLGESKVIRYLESKFNKEQMTFFKLQLRNSGRKNHGQRYTHEEKCMLLALYKQGPKCYRYLSQLFSLPSKRTLCRHSALVQFKAGNNPKLFDFIKSRVSELDPLDKFCTIGWDEMALSTQLTYGDCTDTIDGFVDFGNERIPEFATHALVFMVRGVNIAYKQPVAYFFTDNLNADKLSEIIKLVIQEVLKTGLKIIGSVCDQDQTMAAAVNRLVNPNLRKMKQTGQLLSYKIEGNSIIHCFDPPHILKTIRNNLINKNLKHFISDVWDPVSANQQNFKSNEGLATWDDVKYFYEYTIGTRLLRKLTDEHINPNKKKMKVSLAAQVFSNTVGNTMLYCSQQNQLPTDFAGTAYILIFFNNLFDSMNGGGGKSVVNPLRSSINIKNQSKHFRFWEYAISMLQKMNFVDKKTGEVSYRSTVIQKTISTIKGYMELTKMCLSFGIQAVSLRQMNQDGLENFFGTVRSVCHVAKSPTASNFRSAFTNLIVNNLTSKHSIKSNCQDDKGFALLQDVCDIYDNTETMFTSQQDEVDYENDEDNAIELDVIIDELDLNFFETDALVYQSSYACKHILSTTKCQICKNTLEAFCPLSEHGIIKACDMPLEPENRLAYPTLLFMNKFKVLFKKIDILLPIICHEGKLFDKLISSVHNVQLDGLGCRDHNSEVSKKLKTATVKHCILIFMKDINQILSKKTLIPASNQNTIQTEAFKIVKKKRGIGKYGQNMS